MTMSSGSPPVLASSPPVVLVVESMVSVVEVAPEIAEPMLVTLPASPDPVVVVVVVVVEPGGPLKPGGGPEGGPD